MDLICISLLPFTDPAANQLSAINPKSNNLKYWLTAASETLIIDPSIIGRCPTPCGGLVGAGLLVCLSLSLAYCDALPWCCYYHNDPLPALLQVTVKQWGCCSVIAGAVGTVMDLQPHQARQRIWPSTGGGGGGGNQTIQWPSGLPRDVVVALGSTRYWDHLAICRPAPS